ncbi:MAG TPA: EAL domain-containing protein [Baekduia sp.]
MLPFSLSEQVGEAVDSALAGRRLQTEHGGVEPGETLLVSAAPVAGGGATVIVQQVRPGPGVEQLALATSRLQHAERLARVGSWELDLDGGGVDMSLGLRRMIHADARRTFDLPTLLALVADDDRERVTAEVDAVVAQGGQLHTEFGLTTLEGVGRTVLLRAEVDAGGAAGLLRGAALDTTELRVAESARSASEDLFTQAFDSAPIGMALSDPRTGRYLRVNDAACELLGRSRAELLETSFADVTDAEGADRERVARQAMLNGELDRFEAEKRYLHPDGSCTWAALTIGAVHAPDGAIRAFISHAIDITARKERELRLEAQAADAGWLTRIRAGLQEGRFVLHAQPIVDLATGETIQQELLIRLRGDDGAIIAPGAFLPAAERYGLISAIDRWVVQQAARIAATGTAVEINLSAASLGDRATFSAIETALTDTGADPSLMVFEITETALVDRIDEARRFAERLTRLGCRFALDDFGTGYGTLTYLKHLPVHFIKIDIEFVRDLLASDNDERVVRSIVSLAREFGLATVAEGIEDAATLDRLRELGVDHGQGYFIGRPQPVAVPS